MAEKVVRKKPVRKSLPATIFGDWFRCPRCSGRSIVFNKRAAIYDCRRCGCQFNVDWETHECSTCSTEGSPA